jgi:NAD(P)-dependent dehydrogenase (short-subunit alcohol dehydrogenase family)
MKSKTAKSRLAIVTGAAGGIGRDIVRALLHAGYRVAAWDMDERELGTQFGALGKSRVITQRCDVSSETDVEGAIAAAEKKFDAPYLLINNAATRNTLPLEDLPRAVWDRELAVNLSGMFQCTSSVGRRMLSEGCGVIVNISSVTALSAIPLRGAYSPAKAGILGLTNLTAMEWGPRGIRCNAISPGMIATPAHTKMYGNPDLRKKRETAVPLGRVGDGTDIADVVVFLASDAARYINGVNLPVDGGLSAAMIALLPAAPADDGKQIVTTLELLHGQASSTMSKGTPAKQPTRARAR